MVDLNNTPPLNKVKPYYGFDLDGTIAHFDAGNYTPGEIGEPTPLLRLVKELLDLGSEVRVITARAHTSNPDWLKDMQAISRWLQLHVGQDLKVQSYKCMAMIRLFDDRAVSVETNTGKYVDANARPVVSWEAVRGGN